MSKGADKLHILYGGTKMLMITDPAETCAVGKPPPDSCIIYALRTGFDTSQVTCPNLWTAAHQRKAGFLALKQCLSSLKHQGKLMRTILFSTEDVTANSAESFVFILVLLVFAIFASGYVLHEGLKDPDRSRFRQPLPTRC